jgi:hypothetical protein
LGKPKYVFDDPLDQAVLARRVPSLDQNQYLVVAAMK